MRWHFIIFLFMGMGTIILLLVWKFEFSRIRFISLPVRFVLVIHFFLSICLWQWDCFTVKRQHNLIFSETTQGAFPVMWFLWMVHGFKGKIRKVGALKSSSFSHYNQMVYLIISMFLKPLNINGLYFIFEPPT